MPDRGLSMVSPWSLHGLSIESPSNLHRISIEETSTPQRRGPLHIYQMLGIRRSELEVLKPDASDLGSDG